MVSTSPTIERIEPMTVNTFSVNVTSSDVTGAFTFLIKKKKKIHIVKKLQVNSSPQG